MLQATLRTGAKMPMLGLGTWLAKEGQVKAAVKHALAAGYRHIDGAAIYGNEREIGDALREAFAEGIVKREDIFVTSKLWNTCHRPEQQEQAMAKTLQDLQLDYVDLYLIHWPISFKFSGMDNMRPKTATGAPMLDVVPHAEVWRGMERFVADGRARAIGLSNFNRKQIAAICETAEVAPAVLQIETHPYLANEELIKYCAEQKICVVGYCPLGSPSRPWARPEDPVLLEEPVVTEMAKRLGRTPAQVLLRWQIQRGVTPIPKSVTPERITANGDVFGFELTADDMAALGKLNRNWRSCLPAIILEDGTETIMGQDHPEFPFPEEL